MKIPHLLCPVITEAKAASVLGWVVKEMENRWLLTRVGVKNIGGYNSKHKICAYISVIIDEILTYLVAGKEIENYIQELSQMARTLVFT